jgi:preprotein translocase subunit SecE
MARPQAPSASRNASLGKGGSTPPPAGDAAPKKRTNPVQFAREVRAEARKITWTSRRETWITSVMVFIMVLITTIFFWIVDSFLGVGVSWLSRLGQGA